MWRNFFGQPVNSIISTVFLFLFGLTITSVTLDNAGLPNPLTELGGVLALSALVLFYGKAAFGQIIVS